MFSKQFDNKAKMEKLSGLNGVLFIFVQSKSFIFLIYTG